jgi:hypothetical protein
MYAIRRVTALSPSTGKLRYLDAGKLHVERLGRGFAWLETGTFESLIDAASFVQTLETRQDMKVACLEEIAFRQGFIDRDQVLSLAKSLEKSGYGDYLVGIVESARAERPSRAASAGGKMVNRHGPETPPEFVAERHAN